MRYKPLFESPDFYVFWDSVEQQTYFVGVYRSAKASAVIPILLTAVEIAQFHADPIFLATFNHDVEVNTGQYLDRFAYGTVEVDREAKQLIQRVSFPKSRKWKIFGWQIF